ncbi:MAG: hypothetical protein IKJ25_04670 [Clostridia bacterium]|nr:hypothetical protein [Clostridia bacterium]
MEKEKTKAVVKYINRYACKSVALILSVVILVSICAIPSSAALDINVGNKTILEHYFEMAGVKTSETQHFVPPNAEGSCGYVAMSMVLSYYDTYWHKDFVSENLEFDEGEYDPEDEVIKKIFNAESENIALNAKRLANSQYGFTDFVNDYKDTYLQPHLINMDRYDNPLLLIPGLFGILDGTMVNTLRTYLYDECGFTEDEVVVNIMRESESSDLALYNKMKEQIDLGNPVIYYGSKSVCDIDITSFDDWAKVAGHYMIAYDVCTNDGDEDIKLNLGWNLSEGNTTVFLSDCEFNNNNSIVWLEINKTLLTHEHDKNYYNSDAGEYICACQIYSTHSAHDTNHMSIDSNDGCYNSTHHWNNACHCGDPGPASTVNPHNLSYTYIEIPSTIHFEDCADCGYARYAEHTYNQLVKVSDAYHISTCACGATSSATEAHYAYRYEPFNNSLHTVYCECGKEWTEPHVVSSGAYTSGKKYAPCLACGSLVTIGMTLHPTTSALPRTENGSFILPDGIIVLVDEDIEAYFAGTLEFIYTDENLETE